MAAPVVKAILTDLNGTIIGELNNADSLSVVLQLNRLPTATLKIPSIHRLANYFIDPTWDGLMKIYRNGTLIFHGVVLQGQEAGDTSGEFTVVNAVSPMWRLGFRMLGTTSAGWSLGNAGTTYDLGYIAQQIVNTANTAGYTGISIGSYAASSNGAAGVYFFKDCMSAIAELSAGLGSFEFECAPTEPIGVGQAWPQIALFNVTPALGSVKPNAIFEYGTTKANCLNYSIQTDRSNLCNDGWIQQPAATDNSGALEYTDSTSVARRGLYQAVIDNGGVQWDTLRQAIVQENVVIRTQARQLVTLTPQPNASPGPITDYICGDSVRARIVKNGITRLDGTIRVWGITLNYDKNGNESPSLTLING